MWIRVVELCPFNSLFVFRYIGRLSVKGSGKLQDILSKLKEFAGISPNEEIELYKVNFLLSVLAGFDLFACDM